MLSNLSKFKVFSLVICLTSIIANAAIDFNDNNNTSYKFEIAPDGTFKTEVKFLISQEVSLKDIFIQGFFNEKIITQFTESLKEQEMYRIPQMNFVGNESYRTKVKGEKYGFTQDVYSNCELSYNEFEIIQKCELDLKNENTKKRFYWGKTVTSCKKVFSQFAECISISTGRPQNINFIIIKRSSARLALSGIMETFRSLFNIPFTLNKNKYDVFPYHSQDFESSQFYRANIENAWEETYDHYFNNKQKIKGRHKIIVESSNTGPIFH